MAYLMTFIHQGRAHTHKVGHTRTHARKHACVYMDTAVKSPCNC